MYALVDIGVCAVHSNPGVRVWFESRTRQSLTHAFASEPTPPAAANVLYGAAWLSAAFWTPAFSKNSAASLVVAAAFLVTIAACSLAATLYASFWRLSGHEARRWVSGSAFSLLAGWTAVAAVLNAAIAAKASEPSGSGAVCERGNQDYTILDATERAYSTPVPFVVGVAVSAAAVALPDPVLPVPVAWAVFFMRPSYWNYTVCA